MIYNWKLWYFKVDNIFKFVGFVIGLFVDIFNFFSVFFFFIVFLCMKCWGVYICLVYYG